MKHWAAGYHAACSVQTSCSRPEYVIPLEVFQALQRQMESCAEILSEDGDDRLGSFMGTVGKELAILIAQAKQEIEQPGRMH